MPVPGELHDAIFGSRILIVEDAQINRLFIEHALQKSGFSHIMAVSDGREALDALSQFRPDIIVLDVVMPGMDGFECCRTIRATAAGKTIPIIIQTALTEPKEKIRAFREGATDFITKPIFPEELYARVAVHLEKQLAMKKLQAYKTRVEAELQSARDLQYAILPCEADIDGISERCGLDIASHFDPSSEVGGDCWGIRQLAPHQVAFWIADFSGHGVAAALNVFRLHTCLQEDSPLQGSPGAYMAYLNGKLLQLLPRGQFATMTYGVIDTASNRLFYASAGSTHPFVLREGGASELLDGSGQPLGIARHVYPTQSLVFYGGDSVFFYSDALTETTGKDGNCISESVLARWLAQSQGTAEGIVSGIVGRFQRLTLPQHRRDDLTLGLIRRQKPL